MAFSFNDLNLSKIEVSSAPSILKPGRYAVEVVEAELTPTRSGGTQVKVRLQDKMGSGSINHWIAVHNPTSKENTRIGREQFKALLVHGGHKNPDQPGDIKTVRGLVVGVSVGADSYTDRDGNERTGSKVKGFFPAKDIDPRFAVKTSDSTSTEDDDDIPF